MNIESKLKQSRNGSNGNNNNNINNTNLLLLNTSYHHTKSSSSSNKKNKHKRRHKLDKSRRSMKIYKLVQKHQQIKIKIMKTK